MRTRLLSTSRRTRGAVVVALAAALVLGASLALAACAGFPGFGKSTSERSYFVLHNKTRLDFSDRPIPGLVRVRTLHADAVYEKFQVAVRKNPYELRYDDDHIWIAKPKRMISDLIAQSLKESKRFTGVTRELGEVRPKYNLSGNLHAIEVFDSGDQWFAHLSISLQLTRYDNGEALYFMKYDERRELAQRSFSQAARALSELLAAAVERMLKDLDEVEQLRAPDQARGAMGTTPAAERAATPGGGDDDLDDDEEDDEEGDAAAADTALPGDRAAGEDDVILVPETR